jgi:hypothetical protein
LPTHFPLAQIWPASQVTPTVLGVAQSPEAPQCVRSVSGSMHSVPQKSCPKGQEATHLPAVQSRPCSQLAPDVFAVAQSPEAPQ